MDALVTRLDRRLRACDLDDLPHEWDTRHELIAGGLHISLLRVPRPPRGDTLRRCPEIAVEVMSGAEADRRRDLVDKRDLYLRRGALEYWIADLPARVLLRLVRVGDDWREEGLGPSDRAVTPLLPRWDGVVLGDVFD
jgi:hypothetical protein